MKSMTGFGRGAVTDKNFSVTVDLKTVNNRFLDISLRLSNEMQSLESEIKRLISSRLSRGRVDVNLQYERSEEINYELNRPMITGYLAAMKKMQEDFGLAGEPDINVIAKLPNVMIAKKDDLSDTFASGVTTALAGALEDLEKMLSSEGEMLKVELSSRLDAIEEHLVPIESEAASISEEYRERLTRRISDLLAKSETQIELDQGRLAQEIA